MAVQWVYVCTQDTAPSVVLNNLDCHAGTMQVVAYQYLSADMQSFGSLLNMSASDAAAVGFAVMGVWVVAWTFKMAIRTLGNLNHDSES